jgi:dTMP kinase
LFVTIEGIEGSGKTTQVALLAEALGRDSAPVLATREPGGTELGARIRSLLLEETIAITPVAELFLILADRAEHVDQSIRPALDRGEWVLCDRFSDSTIAYQAYGRGLDLHLVRQSEAFARRGLAPNRTFVLDCPVDVGLERTVRRRGGGRGDRFEGEDTSFHERVRRGFLELARESPERVRVLDGGRSADRVHEEILSELRALGAGRPHR